MDVLDEAKLIMEKIGCEKTFPVYGMDLENIAEVRSYNEKGEYIELESNIDNLVSFFEKKLVLDQNKPIECPLNSSMNKYLEFYLKDRSICICNVDSFESDRIVKIIDPLLKKYNWTIKK